MARNQKVGEFLAHHRDTVVPISIAMMSDQEMLGAILKALEMPGHTYDTALAILKAGPQPSVAQFVESV